MENEFKYTYSAPRQKELEAIRKKYAPVTSAEEKLEQIKKLDRSVETLGLTVALANGITASLVLGVGMCCCLLWTDWFVPGIIIGILGLAGCGITYPLYKKIISNRRAKVGPQILKLMDEM